MPYKDRETQLAAQRKWYQDNKEKQAARNKHTKREITQVVRSKKDKPCSDCGIKYPYYVMQFDHIGTDKIAKIGSMIKSNSLQVVLDEIAKCEVVCANCHAVRTWQRLQK